MLIVHLLASDETVTDLTKFAERLFDALDVPFERRESSNYVEGYYFLGRSDGLIFKAAYPDVDGNADLPYWMSVATSDFKKEKLEALVDHLVRSKLLPKSFRVARMANFGKANQQRLNY